MAGGQSGQRVTFPNLCSQTNVFLGYGFSIFFIWLVLEATLRCDQKFCRPASLPVTDTAGWLFSTINRGWTWQATFMLVKLKCSRLLIKTLLWGSFYSTICKQRCNKQRCYWQVTTKSVLSHRITGAHGLFIEICSDSFRAVGIFFIKSYTNNDHA